MEFSNFIAVLEFLVAIITCYFTYKMYTKTHDILDVISIETKRQWNKKQLEKLFSELPIECIEMFLSNPTIIHDELWQGSRRVDLSSFQYNGGGKETIVNFLNRFNDICLMSFEQTPSRHWKYQPISKNETYDKEVENQRLNILYDRVNKMRPLYNNIKQILTDYCIDITDLNHIAYERYHEEVKIREQMNL